MCNHKVPCSAPDGSVVYRPCGKCLDCLRQYQQDWTCRLSEEFKAWQGGSVIFFTLTYAEPMLPVMVTYNHPVTKSQIQYTIRQKNFQFLSSRLSLLGLDNFFYTRPVGQNNRQFFIERRALQDSYLDIPEFERPLIGVPTVCYEDVNTWIRYCRKWFDRHIHTKPFRDKRVNPYLMQLTWKNIHGVESSFPDCAYTSSFKYWITSEYGPSTLRPHYHGILFGVDEDTFRNVFAPYWRMKFGDGQRVSVDYSVYDPQKGGAMYVAKYCAKGSFEHPLVAKSIHYPSGKEYISKFFINSVKWFGTVIYDEDTGDIRDSFPMALPTFHLISKGIGVRYCFKASLQKYWDVQCDEFTHFVTKDLSIRKIPFNFFNAIELNTTTSVKYDMATPGSSIATKFGQLFTVEKIESRKRPKLIKSTVFVLDPCLDIDDFVVFQNSFYNKKYIRTYVYNNQAESFECLLPRYYRRYLLSPFTSSAVASVARSKSDADFNRKRRQIGQIRCENSKSFAICQNAFGEKIKRKLSEEQIAYRFSRFYHKSLL